MSATDVTLTETSNKISYDWLKDYCSPSSPSSPSFIGGIIGGFLIAIAIVISVIIYLKQQPRIQERYGDKCKTYD